MALSVSNTTTDSTGRELLEYGTAEFPIAFYLDDLDIVESPWHWHPEFELVVVSKGREEVSAGGKTVLLKEGEGVFINSGVLHMMAPLEENSEQHAMVFNSYVLGDPASVYFRKYTEPLRQNPSLSCVMLRQDGDWQSAVLEAAEQAWYSGAYEAAGCELTVRNCLSSIFFALLQHQEEVGSVTELGERDAERIKRMLGYLDIHLREEISLAEIAASAAISESEALRCFRRTMHTTPIQYLKELRISRACTLLRNTERNISDIAEQCGYLDMSYFSKTFRELKHCTPSQYRKRCAEHL